MAQTLAGGPSLPEAPAPTAPVILIVDDDEYILGTLHQILRRIRARILEAGTASEALVVAASDPPAVAVVDVGLPDLDGYALAIRLRELLAPRQVGIVILTGQLPDQARLAEIGDHRVMTKPFRLRDLRETILDLLEPELAARA